MSKSVNKFTDIGQFRNVIKHIYDMETYVGLDENDDVIRNTEVEMPKIKFTGFVKLHGSNASVGFNSNDEIFYQSRNRILTLSKDNAGFVFFANSKEDIFYKWYNEIKNNIEKSSIIFFGEWCGGNIQKGVAINGLEKMFVLFAVKIVPDNEELSSYYLHQDKWKHLNDNSNLLFNINDFKTYEIEIDFNNPKESQNEMVSLVEEVENECPVGKAFGRKYGVDCTVGEGIVWVGWYNNNRYIFKTKGTKHSSSKVKTIASIDIDKLNSINEFIDYAVTENRLNQAIEQVFTVQSLIPDIKMTGDFLKWIVNDIIKEESDTLLNNNLEPKDVKKQISKRAVIWFKKYLDELI